MGFFPFLIASAYLFAHLFTLAPALEDIDSINFALGLREFNPAEHQPHPPGYPIYIAAGRLSLAVVNAVRPSLERVAAEALALSFWSALAGALALIFAWRVFGLLMRDADPADRLRVSLWATILVAACSLFWVTGVRPMSDMPGLAVALAAQSLLLDGKPKAGAFLAGLALGVRSQTLWLTAPLVAVELYNRSGASAWRERLVIVLLAAAGALGWAIPLLVATGGLDAYLAALGSQAGEDFAFVDMLWVNPSVRRLAFGLIHMLVQPWGSIPLAAAILLLAATGALVMLLTHRRSLGLLIAAFAPYAAFHLVFQETVTIRYALPVVVPVAFLAARALALAGRMTNVVAMPVAVLSLVIGVHVARLYAADPHPAFRAIDAAAHRADVDHPAVFTSHFELRRPIRAAEPAELPVVYAPRQREWLELVNYWAGGGRGLVWFLANPGRTDLDLIDRHGRRDVVRYRWQVEHRPELGGTRPLGVDWYRLRPPQWFLGEGWSLTPETGGVAQATNAGPGHKPIVGYVRRLSAPMHALVGGRNLDPAAEAVSLEMTLDDTVIDRWTLGASEPTFLRFVELPAGLPGPAETYAQLTIAAKGSGERRPSIAIKQFDIQPAERPIFGLGAGWHDEEYDGAIGLRWRWMSERAVVLVRRPQQAVRVRMRGESPLRYFDAAPTITLSAGGRVIEKLQPSADWEWSVVVPADVVAASNGELVIASTQVFVPAEITGSPDTRRLSLRIFAFDVESVR